MDFTQLDALADKPIDGLSKGMKQRLCLGRTMIHDPSVLVLDEPAAGLDPRARIELREMIGRLAADGKAILISSHILTELAEMCHRVGIIEAGPAAGRRHGRGNQRAGARLRPGARPRARRRRTARRTGWPRASDVADVRGESELITFSHSAIARARPRCCGRSSRRASPSSNSARGTRAWKTCSSTSRRAACNERRLVHRRPNARFRR